MSFINVVSIFLIGVCTAAVAFSAILRCQGLAIVNLKAAEEAREAFRNMIDAARAARTEMAEAADSTIERVQNMLDEVNETHAMLEEILEDINNAR